MSVKELKFYWPMYDSLMYVDKDAERIRIKTKQGLDIEQYFYLDRNQAHLLYLYLQEHLRYETQAPSS